MTKFQIFDQNRGLTHWKNAIFSTILSCFFYSGKAFFSIYKILNNIFQFHFPEIKNAKI